jgi:hypothetical protein
MDKNQDPDEHPTPQHYKNQCCGSGSVVAVNKWPPGSGSVNSEFTDPDSDPGPYYLSNN